MSSRPDRCDPLPASAHVSQEEAESRREPLSNWFHAADEVSLHDAADESSGFVAPEQDHPPKRPPSIPLWRRSSATSHNLPALPPTELLLSSHDEAHAEPEPQIAEPLVDLNPTLTVFEKANLSSVPDLVKLAKAFHVDSKEIERDSVLELIHKVLETADDSEPLKLCRALSLMAELEADLGRDDDAESRYDRAVQIGWTRVEEAFLTELLMSYSRMLNRIEKKEQARTYASFARVMTVRAEFDRRPGSTNPLTAVKEHAIDPDAFQTLECAGGFDRFAVS